MASGLLKVVWKFSNDRFTEMAKKAIWHIRRIGASGIHGDDFEYKTLWDEFCHETQYGDFDLDAWEQTIHPFCAEIISRLPETEKQLLFFGTEEDWDDEVEDEVPIDDDALTKELMSRLRVEAGNRDLSRFEGGEFS
ncbi:MAG: hypothetical protein HQL72_03720 [Magnetococcales bacterium]|nr:hypothetical protein [Magnetococcales bacterium]